MFAVLMFGIFLMVLTLFLGVFYFLIVVPANKRRVLKRLANIQDASLGVPLSSEIGVARKKAASSSPAIDRLLSHIPKVEQLQLFMRQAAVSMMIDRLLLIVFCIFFCILLIALAAGASGIAAWPLAIAGGSVPFWVIAFKRMRRFAKFEELFPDAVDLMCRAVRAGHAFTTGLELIANELSEPIASEFRQAYDEQNLGLPLREALYNLTERMPLPDVAIFVSALQIQRETGGNLAEVLDNLSYTMRERFKVQRQVRVYTAEGRLSLVVLMALPPVTAFLMYLGNPVYLSPLFKDPIGTKALMGAAALQIMGYITIRRLTRIRV